MHYKEYQEYLIIKATGIARPIIPTGPIKIESGEQDNEDDGEAESEFFMRSFFEICERLPNGCIKANCLTCQRLGRANLIQSQCDHSNLLAHLQVSG